jgi:hypothetical protein
MAKKTSVWLLMLMMFSFGYARVENMQQLHSFFAATSYIVIYLSDYNANSLPRTAHAAEGLIHPLITEH